MKQIHYLDCDSNDILKINTPNLTLKKFLSLQRHNHRIFRNSYYKFYHLFSCWLTLLSRVAQRYFASHKEKKHWFKIFGSGERKEATYILLPFIKVYGNFGSHKRGYNLKTL